MRSSSLVRKGSNIVRGFQGQQSLVLRGGDPAILFEKSSNPDVEIEVDGENMLVPLYNPYLLTDTISRLVNKIQAEQAIRLQSAGNIHIGPGKIDSFEGESLTLQAQEQIKIAAEFTYSGKGTQPELEKVRIPFDGNLNLSAGKGISTKGVDISAKTITMSTSEGDIRDDAVSLFPIYSALSNRDMSMHRETVTSSFSASDSMHLSAPKGKIEHEGTDLTSGEGGIVIESEKYFWQSAYEDFAFFHRERRSSSQVHRHVPKSGGVVQTPGAVIFRSKDTSLIGAKFVVGTFSNPVDGTLRAAPALATQTSKSESHKRGFLGLGRSSRKTEERQEHQVPTQIISDHFKSLGTGTYHMQSTILRALDAEITKNLRETTNYDKILSRVTSHSSGFFAPRIKADPVVEALRGINNVMTIGDIVPTTFNTIGTVAQTASHAAKADSAESLFQ